MKAPNLNTILAVAGGVGVFAPDLASVGAWLGSTGVPWLGYLARGLGAAALLASSLPRIATRLRPLLAAANLATAPGEVAPVPVVAAPAQTSGDAEGKVLPIVTPPTGGAGS